LGSSGGIFIVYIETIKAKILQQLDRGLYERGTKRRIADIIENASLGICVTSDRVKDLHVSVFTFQLVDVPEIPGKVATGNCIVSVRVWVRDLNFARARSDLSEGI